MRTVNIHASVVRLDGAAARFGAPADWGVLLLGESGAGKSDIALQLIARGALLVADDRADLFSRKKELWARSPAQLAGLLEVRGVGIVRMPFAAETRIALAIRLVAPEAVPRLPEPAFYEAPAPLDVVAPPLLKLSAKETSGADRIVLAAAAFAKGLFAG